MKYYGRLRDYTCCVCELLSVKHEIHIKLALLLSSISLYYSPQFSTEPEFTVRRSTYAILQNRSK